MKTSLVCSTLVALMASSDVSGFAPSNAAATSTSTTQIAASAAEDGDSRRKFISKTLATGFAYSAAALATTGVLAPLPANASAESKVNTRLKA